MRKPLVFLAGVFFLGCGGNGSHGGSPIVSEPDFGSCPTIPVTTVGQKIWFDAFNATLTLKETGGGLIAAPPTGAACTPHLGTFTFRDGDRQLTWSYCVVANDGQSASDYAVSQGNRPLTATEVQALATKLSALVVVDNSGCGADLPTEQAIVTSCSVDLTYDDGFDACHQAGKTFVDHDGLDALDQELRALAAAK